MTGMDGINSLQKMLGALQVNEAGGVNGAGQVSGQASAKAAGTAAASTGVDHASLSAAGGLVTADTSDVRMDKVAALQQAIAGGTYKVSANDVADKMVESLLK